ncbi:hypothetical protein EDC04DRAFT_2541758, partial [Pisolithus marmoratus]
DMAHYRIEPLDWEVLQDLEFILEAPSLPQHTMSGEQSPLLSSVLPAFETFITQWQTMAASPAHPQLCPFIQEGLSWANHYHEHMHANKTYLLAMCMS